RAAEEVFQSARRVEKLLAVIFGAATGESSGEQLTGQLSSNLTQLQARLETYERINKVVLAGFGQYSLLHADKAGQTVSRDPLAWFASQSWFPCGRRIIHTLRAWFWTLRPRRCPAQWSPRSTRTAVSAVSRCPNPTAAT